MSWASKPRIPVPPPTPAPTVRPVTSDVYDAIGRVTSITSPLSAGEGQGEGSNTTAYLYDFGSDTDTLTTLQGATVAVASGSAVFNNLPQAPGLARTYVVYVQSSSAPANNGSGYTITENGTASLTLSFVGSATTPLGLSGSDWYELGTVTLGSGDSSSTLTVGYSGSATVSQVALLAQTSAETYDADGNLTSEVDPLGNTTSYAYNDLGLPAQQQVNSSSPLLGPIYDKAGNVYSDTDLLGNVTSYQYNDLGQVAVTTQPAPQSGQSQPVTTDSYDADGDLVSRTDPLGNVTTYTWDAFGNEVSQSLPNPTTGAAGGPTTTFAYDLDRNEVSTTDPLGNVTAYTFDAFGNQVSQSLPDPANGKQDSGSPKTTFTYDAMGDQLSLTDPDGNTTSWTYDGLGRETGQSETVALGYNSSGTVQTTTASYSNQYDLDGNLTESVDADGQAIAYAYNWSNQETSETWYNASDIVVGTVACGYDVEGNLLSATNTANSSSVAAYTYQFDGAGRVTGESVQLAGLTPDVVLTAAYDYNGNRTGLSANIGGTLNSNGTVTGGTPDFADSYSYDTLGNMTDVTQSGRSGGNGVAAKNVVLGYDGDSRLASVNLYASTGTSNAVAAAGYTYDDASRLTALSYTAQGSTLASYQWSYDTDSRVTQEKSSADATTGNSWGLTNYSYDATSQLTGTSYTTFANAPTSNTSQSYDSNGNRTSSGSVTGAGNRLLYDGTYYYAYDANGNRTAKFKSTSGALDSTATDITTYQWNDKDQLTAVDHYTNYTNYQSRTDDSEVDYADDAFGRMVSRSPVGGTAENYVYDGQNMALALNGSGQVVERELYGPAVDQVLATEEVTTGSGLQSAGTVNWLLTDNQGTVRDVARFAAGTTSVVDHLVDDAFGQVTWQSSATNQPTFMYQGMWQDPATGLSSTPTRIYDPATGTWLGPDRAGFNAGDTNLYRFCGNSPTNATDPTGMAGIYMTHGYHGPTPGKTVNG